MVNASAPDETLYNLNCIPWYTHAECNGRVYSVTREAIAPCACTCHRPAKKETETSSKLSKATCAE